MKHGRLPWFDPAHLTPQQRALYDHIVAGPRAQGPQAFRLTDDAGRLHGPFNALLVSPQLGSALQALGAAIRYKSVLPPRVREIAILELSVVRRCEFEWYAHERVGRAVGLTEAELTALRGAEPAPTFDPTEQLVRDLVRVILEKRVLSDATYSRARAALNEQQLMDLIALVGYYDLLALNLAIWRTPLPDDARPVFPDNSEVQ